MSAVWPDEGQSLNDKTATLLEVVGELSDLDDQLTIYAQEPWNPTSLAVVAHEAEDGTWVQYRDGIAFSYFLEVFIALDFLKGWEANSAEPIGLPAKCNRLIEYAINDA